MIGCQTSKKKIPPSCSSPGLQGVCFHVDLRYCAAIPQLLELRVSQLQEKKSGLPLFLLTFPMQFSPKAFHQYKTTEE